MRRRVRVRDVPQQTKKSILPLGCIDDPQPQFGGLSISTVCDGLESGLTIRFRPQVAANISVNRDHSWDRTIHEFPLQVLLCETQDDLRRIGDMVLMTNDGNELGGLTCPKTATEVTMRIATSKVHGIREDAFLIDDLSRVKHDTV